VSPPRKRTPFVGLTGAVAAGKSSALAALERLGAQTLSSDAIVHDLLATERVRDLLVARWGAEVASEGQIDRARVGAIVFERPEELAWLEGNLHPLVGERISAWRDALPPGAPLAVVEVPLLFEAGMEGIFDATICVVASESARAERAGARGTAALEQRAGRQLSQEEKAARATYVVRNDGPPDSLEAELARLVSEIGTEGESAA
jgi:dephospho-CoA kinase